MICKRLRLIFMFALLQLSVLAQVHDKWVNVQERAINYPHQKYITGYAVATAQKGEELSAAFARASKEAAKNAASSIRTQIENLSQMKTKEVELNGKFEFEQAYTDYTKQTSNAEIAGLKTEIYFDDKEALAHAFCYVLRSDLVNYYKAQINLHLKKIEDDIAMAKLAAKAGQKLKAKKQCQNALEPLTRAEYAQSLLSAVAASDSIGMQTNRCSDIKQALFQQLIDLEQSIYVCVKSSENNFGTNTTILNNQLKSVMAKNQCSFTNDNTQADYVITITAITRKHDVDNPNFKYSYADVKIDLFSNYKKMSVFNDEISVKGGGTTHQTAGREALKTAANEVWERINTWILEK